VPCCKHVALSHIASANTATGGQSNLTQGRIAAAHGQDSSVAFDKRRQYHAPFNNDTLYSTNMWQRSKRAKHKLKSNSKKG